MSYSFRGIFPLSSWNNFLWILEYRKINLNIYILEAVACTGVNCILEALWLSLSDLSKSCGDKHQTDDGTSSVSILIKVHY